MINKFRFIISIVILGFMIDGLYAQTTPDSVHIRSVTVKSPRQAMFRSAILPGWGQVYNGKWFKALLVFGTEAAMTGNAVYYNKRALDSQSEDERLFYENYRNTFVWWFAGIYLLNILDAYVDAHLFQFDISPDLTSEPNPNLNMRITLKVSFNLSTCL